MVLYSLLPIKTIRLQNNWFLEKPNQLNNATNRANGLQNQLDAANSRNNNLQNQLNNENSQVTSLQTQLGAANSRANDLQKQFDDCKKAKKISEDEVAKLKTDKVNLENANKTLTIASNKKDTDAKKYYDDKLQAENRILTVLEPYIKQLRNYITSKGLK
ncbi:hypothetical protein QQ045_029446 [Rhodiola kirilowii]